jgi:DNA-binding NtrC family response regulator
MRKDSCLIVENEPYLSESISSKLEVLGYTTKIVPTIGEAMELERIYSTLLLSTNFSDDRRFFKLLSKYREASTILLVSFVNNDVILKSIEHGANDYIIKPFLMDLLLYKIDFLKRSREFKEREKRYIKFIESSFGTKIVEKVSASQKLPMIIFSKESKAVDYFSFLVAKDKNRVVEMVNSEDLERIENLNSPDFLYYIRDISHLEGAEREKFFQKVRDLPVVVGGTSRFEKRDGFNYIELPSEGKIPYTGKILSVAEYVKQIIINNQYKMPDTEISKHLGISRKSLWEKRRKFGIQKRKKGE